MVHTLKVLRIALACLLALLTAATGVPAQALAEGEHGLEGDELIALDEPAAELELPEESALETEAAEQESAQNDEVIALEEELAPVEESAQDAEAPAAETDATKGTDANKTAKTPNVLYRVHRQTYGWEGSWRRNGRTSGTTGQSKRLEGIKIKLSNKPVSGSIQYRTHVQTYGWQGWKKDGALSGTTGKAKRLEAIQIKLTGQMARHYDVWYRVHAQHFGWMGWAKNGARSGTAGCSYRLEAIQIKLVRKGGSAPGSTSNPFRERKKAITISGHGWKATLPSYWTGKVKKWSERSYDGALRWVLSPNRYGTQMLVDFSEYESREFPSWHAGKAGTVKLRNGKRTNVYWDGEGDLLLIIKLKEGHYLIVRTEQCSIRYEEFGGLSQSEMDCLGDLQSLGTMHYGYGDQDVRIPLKCLQAIASGLSY